MCLNSLIQYFLKDGVLNSIFEIISFSGFEQDL